MGWGLALAAGAGAASMISVLLARALGHVLVAGVVVACAAGVVTFVVPRQWLPSGALAATVLIPVRALPVPEILTVISPGLLVITVWLLRGLTTRDQADRRHDKWAGLRALIVTGFGVWLLLGAVTSDYVGNSLAWGFTFALTVLCVWLAGADAETIALVKVTWYVLASTLALYAMVEFALQANPLFDPLYARAPFPVVQNWSVYRVTTTLGHPLTNSLFFSLSFALALGDYFSTRRPLVLSVSALSAIGLALTASRGGLVAAAAGAVAVIACALLVMGRGGRFAKWSIAVIAAVGLIAMTQAGVLQDRSSSREAQVSSADRSAALDVAIRVSGDAHWLGTGPGTSNPATRDFVANSLIIENSYLQLLISVGIPGLALFLALLAVSCLVAFRHGRAGPLGALVAYAVAAGGFNFLEANRPAHVLLGLVLVLCWGPDPAAGQADVRPTGPPRASAIRRA